MKKLFSILYFLLVLVASITGLCLIWPEWKPDEGETWGGNFKAFDGKKKVWIFMLIASIVSSIVALIAQMKSTNSKKP